MTDEDLDRILDASRRNNDRRGITGLLIYDRGLFLQVLEGQHDDVDAIYNKIIADGRHRNISILSNRYVVQREFGDWLMAFARGDSLFESDGFVDYRKMGEELTIDDTDVAQILSLFKNGLLVHGEADRSAADLVSVSIGPNHRSQTTRTHTFLMNFGRAVSLTVPDLPVKATLPDGKTVKFNVVGELSAGDIEIF